MRLGKEHLGPLLECPFCFHEMDRSSGVNHDKAPTPGAATICIRCGGVSLFDEGLQLRAPTEDERRELLELPEVRAIQTAISACGLPRDCLPPNSRKG